MDPSRVRTRCLRRSRGRAAVSSVHGLAETEGRERIANIAKGLHAMWIVNNPLIEAEVCTEIRTNSPHGYGLHGSYSHDLSSSHADVIHSINGRTWLANAQNLHACIGDNDDA